MLVNYTRMAKVGEYNAASVSVSKTLTHGDLGYTDEEWVAYVQEVGTDKAHEVLNDKALDLLDTDFAEELREARAQFE